MAFKIKLWGVRGSIPAPKKPIEIKQLLEHHFQNFFKQGYTNPSDIAPYFSTLQTHDIGGYGGNTSCAEVFTDSTSLIIDGGSGLRMKGFELMLGPCGLGRGEVHILFTHFHWDHLIGLPFFVPFFIPGNKIHLYAVQPELEHIIRTVFSKPYFPVPFDQLPSDIHFHQLEPRKTKVFSDIEVTPYQLDHPDPCWGFKLANDNKNISYCVDTECIRVTREELGEDLPLYQNIDLMVFDAQYTIQEATEKINWGHASASFGLDLAVRENIKRILFVHHDPSASDTAIHNAHLQAEGYYKALVDYHKKSGETFYPVQWTYGVEGQVEEV
jgi:phosphoribosyl 1,2-cyclic phosphodiesterase